MTTTTNQLPKATRAKLRTCADANCETCDGRGWYLCDHAGREVDADGWCEGEHPADDVQELMVCPCTDDGQGDEEMCTDEACDCGEE